MEKRDKEEMSRRKFLKIVGVSAAASAAALYGCASEGKPASSEASVLGEVPVDKMTYRVSPKGERVSLSLPLPVPENVKPLLPTRKSVR